MNKFIKWFLVVFPLIIVYFLFANLYFSWKAQYDQQPVSETQITKTSPVLQQANVLNKQSQKNYELYQGEIWANSPINCSGDLSCIVKQADTCSSAKGIFSAFVRDYNSGKDYAEKYELGIQGQEYGECQIYFKLLSNKNIFNANNYSYALPPNIIEDASYTNYIMCRFKKNNDLKDLLKAGNFINDSGLFDIGYYHNIMGGSSYDIKSSIQCFAHTYVDATNQINVVEYGLVKGEGLEDASSKFRIIVNDIDYNNNATFTVIKNDQQSTLTIDKNKEQYVLGYKIKVLDNFGQKNVSSDLKEGIMEPMVSFTIGL